MKKLLLAFGLLLLLLPNPASAQCSGVFSASTYCGASISGPPKQLPNSTLINAVCTATPSICVSVFGYSNVKWYGATGNGSTDDTVAMQACQTTGVVCYYPTGVYAFSLLTISSGGMQCAPSANLVSTDNSSSDIITYTGTGTLSKPTFDGCLIQSASGTKAAGAAIAINPASGETPNAYINNNYLVNFPVGVHLYRASHWVGQNNTIINAKSAGYWVENRNNSDSGDGRIVGGLINDGNATGASILYQSGGGLKVHGVKMLGGSVGVNLQWNGTASGILLVSGPTSIEAMTTASVNIGRTSGTGTFANIVLDGLQFDQAPIGVGVDTSGAFSNINMTGGSYQAAAGGTAINLGTVNTFLIDGVSINATNCIAIGAASAGGRTGINTYSGCSPTITDASGTTIVNGTVAASGTGVVTFTTHGVLLGEGTSPIVPTAAMTDGQLLVGQTSADPLPKTVSGDCTFSSAGVLICTKTNGTSFGALATVMPGTGVATALGVNIGTAGSFVVNGGALGTPSSGIGTNITNVNAASLGGATFAAPGPIGSGTPSTGAFTTVSATTFTGALTGHASLDLALTGGTMSGTIAMGGNQINNVIIGTTTPLAGSFNVVNVTGTTVPILNLVPSSGATHNAQWYQVGNQVGFAGAAVGDAIDFDTGTLRVTLPANIASTSPTTGTLGVTGGIGASGAIWGGTTINAVSGFTVNGTAGITTTCTIAVGNVLTFTLGIITAKGGVAGCT